MKYIKSSLLVLLFVPVFFISTQAAKYTDEYPTYIPYSGGAYFEIFDSRLGTCSAVFPIEFKDRAFGFIRNSNGSVTNIVNVTNSTINGNVITSSGQVYVCRASRFSGIEYRLSNTSGTYTSLSPDMSSLSNTNISFVTDDIDYYNENSIDKDKYIMVILTLIALSEFLGLCTNLLRRGYR